MKFGERMVKVETEVKHVKKLMYAILIIVAAQGGAEIIPLVSALLG